VKGDALEGQSFRSGSTGCSPTTSLTSWQLLARAPTGTQAPKRRWRRPARSHHAGLHSDPSARARSRPRKGLWRLIGLRRRRERVEPETDARKAFDGVRRMFASPPPADDVELQDLSRGILEREIARLPLKSVARSQPAEVERLAARAPIADLHRQDRVARGAGRSARGDRRRDSPGSARRHRPFLSREHPPG